LSECQADKKCKKICHYEFEHGQIK